MTMFVKTDAENFANSADWRGGVARQVGRKVLAGRSGSRTLGGKYWRGGVAGEVGRKVLAGRSGWRGRI